MWEEAKDESGASGAIAAGGGGFGALAFGPAGGTAIGGPAIASSLTREVMWGRTSLRAYGLEA